MGPGMEGQTGRSGSMGGGAMKPPSIVVCRHCGAVIERVQEGWIKQDGQTFYCDEGGEREHSPKWADLWAKKPMYWRGNQRRLE
jgi:hypothetical protein